jgi:hypothetical protein
MDLCFDHPNWATQFLSGFDSFLHRESGNAARNWDTKLTQEFLGLVFVYFHQRPLKANDRGDSQDMGQTTVFLMRWGAPMTSLLRPGECIMLHCNNSDKS